MVLVEKFGFRSCFSSHLVSRTEGRSMYNVRQGTGAPTSHSVKAKELMIVVHSLFKFNLDYIL